MRYDLRKLGLGQFFLKAALATYAGGQAAEKVGDKWRFRHVSEDGRMVYEDEYVVSDGFSGGTTTICLDGIPAWMTQYQGWCQNDDPEVLAFLKQALCHAYRQGAFLGGRGPKDFVDPDRGDLHYANVVEDPYSLTNFSRFRGRERIWRDSNPTAEVFYHVYQGMLLGDPA